MPRDDTRISACLDPYFAFSYAFYVDKESREDTRKATCENPEWAYCYALEIDKCYHEDIYNALKNTEYEEKYEAFLNELEKEKII